MSAIPDARTIHDVTVAVVVVTVVILAIWAAIARACRKDIAKRTAYAALVEAGTPESDLPASAPPAAPEAAAPEAAAPNEPTRCGLCQVMGGHDTWCIDAPKWGDGQAAVEPEDDQESTRPMSRAARRKLAEPLPDDAPLIEALRVGTDAYDAVDAPRVPSVAVVLAGEPDEESVLFAAVAAKRGEPAYQPTPAWNDNTSAWHLNWLALRPFDADQQPALESAERAR